jgi:DNA sulfur modification protein DndD
MKLIKLEINNFRQFYGKQIIDFASESNKGVTLIHGENNGGKTALLNALRWCLYEETTDNLQDSKNLLNKHALSQGINTFSVYIQLVHENRLLEIRRTKSRSKSDSNLQIFEIKEGCYSQQEKNPNTLINTLLPKEMSQYFFYQGEGTGTLNSQNDFSHIKSAISKVLGLTVSEKTLTHLNGIKNTYQKELRQFDTNNEIEKNLSNKELLEANLIKNQVEFEQKKALLEVAEKEYESQITNLARFDKTSIDEKLKIRNHQEQILSDLERQLIRLLADKSKSILNWINNSYSKKLGSIEISKIDIAELNNSSRYTVDKQLIKAIRANQECICGAAIKNNSPAAEIIAQLENSAVDPELKRRWQRAEELHTKLANFSSPKQAMANLLSQIDDCQDRISELKKSINELSHTIVESDIDDIKIIENKRESAKRECNQLREQIPKLEVKIRQAKVDIKDIDSRVMRLSSTQPRADKFRSLIIATDKIIELFNKSISSSKEGVDLVLLKKMQAFFGRVAFNGYTVKKDSSSESGSFTWTIVDKEGKRVAAGNGYQAMLSISFIVALIQFSKGRKNSKQHLLTPGTIAPFIADSILAFIGPDNGRELVRYIADSVEQCIFMFSQAQWTEKHTDIGIRDKIGKEYNLVQHTVLTEKEFKGQYPTKLIVQGKEHDVVLFGSEFDKVTIEEVLTNG